MRKYTILMLGLLALLLSACGPVVRGSGRVIEEHREVSGFHRVSMSGLGEIIVTQGETESLTIEAEDNLMRYIESDVRGGTLYIGFDVSPRRVNIIPTETIRFYLGVKQLSQLSMSGAGRMRAPSLEAEDLGISISGAGDIDVGSVTAEELEVNVSGAGDVDIVSLTAESLTVHLSGAGGVDVAGKVVTQEARLSGVGGYNAGGLESRNATMTISGLGGATIHVTDDLDVRISGAGNVKYYGSPSVTESISGLGKTIEMGNP